MINKSPADSCFANIIHAEQVQGPSSLAREKGVVPTGNWMGDTLTPSTIQLPTALSKSMAKFKTTDGTVDVDHPTDLAKSMGKPVTSGKSVISGSSKK